MTNNLRLIVGDLETNKIIHSVNIKKNPQRKVIVGPNFNGETHPVMVLMLESGLFKMDYLVKRLIKIEHNVANGNIEWVLRFKGNEKHTHMISKSFNTGQLVL